MRFCLDLPEVGFEPTLPKKTELKSAALDHSAIQAPAHGREISPPPFDQLVGWLAAGGDDKIQSGVRGSQNQKIFLYGIPGAPEPHFMPQPTDQLVTGS